jgi:thioredoxin reductase (NADPH)
MTHKLIIIGSGPAGYTAALYAGRAELKPVIFTGESSGGQLMNTTVVENWPGADEGVMGPDLMIKMRGQAKKFGAEIIDKTVTKVELTEKIKKIWVGNPAVAGQGVYEAEAVIIATGAEPIMLGVPGEKDLMGKGVAVCAVCDAPFYKDKTTMVIGGGDAAIEDAMALTKHANKVYMVVRRDELRASKIMSKRAMSNSKIEILWNTELKEVVGVNKVEKVVLHSQDKTGKENQSLNDIHHSGIGGGRMITVKVDGVFMAIGHKPATKLFKDQVELDEKGYIKTTMVYPDVTQTNIEGVFAAGDVVDYRYQQAVTAAGMGCQAALDTEKWLEGKHA